MPQGKPHLAAGFSQIATLQWRRTSSQKSSVPALTLMQLREVVQAPGHIQMIGSVEQLIKLYLEASPRSPPLVAEPIGAERPRLKSRPPHQHLTRVVVCSHSTDRLQGRLEWPP